MRKTRIDEDEDNEEEHGLGDIVGPVLVSSIGTAGGVYHHELGDGHVQLRTVRTILMGRYHSYVCVDGREGLNAPAARITSTGLLFVHNWRQEPRGTKKGKKGTVRVQEAILGAK